MTSSVKPAKITINNNCDTCYECVDVCREQAIEVINGNVEVNEDKCAFCEDCVDICEYGAIDVRWNDEQTEFQDH